LNPKRVLEPPLEPIAQPETDPKHFYGTRSFGLRRERAGATIMDEGISHDGKSKNKYQIILEEFNQLAERFDDVEALLSTDPGVGWDKEGKLIVGVFVKDTSQQLEALKTIECLTSISRSSFVKREQSAKRGDMLLPQVLSVEQYIKRYKQLEQQHPPAIDKAEQIFNKIIDDAMKELDTAPTIHEEHDTEIDFDR
jgi:hypothetical protein